MKFRPIKELGRGSQGQVMLVKLAVDPRPLVMKKIHVGELTAKQRALTEKEAHILKQMRHSNIIRFEYSFTEKQSLYIFTEFADGGDLAKSIALRKKSKQEFQESQAMKIFVQVCFALKHVHERHILHRDLKPGNIFLMQNDVVKLGDFGISKMLDSTLSLAATKVGTPYYLSPEICEDKPYGKASDIWALGAVLYEILTLSMPFQAKGFHALVNKILRAEPASLPNTYSKDCNQICMALLSKVPSERPSVNQILSWKHIKKYARECLSYTIISHRTGVINELEVESPHGAILPCASPNIGDGIDTSAVVSSALPHSYSIGDSTTELKIQIPHSTVQQASGRQQQMRNPYASRQQKGIERKKDASTKKPLDTKDLNRKGKAVSGGRNNNRGQTSGHLQGGLYACEKVGKFGVQLPPLGIEKHKNGIDMDEQVIITHSRKGHEYTTANAVWRKNIDGNMEQIGRRQQHQLRKHKPNQGRNKFSNEGKRSTSKSIYTAEILEDCNSAPMTISKDLLSHLQINRPDDLLKEYKSLCSSAQNVA